MFWTRGLSIAEEEREGEGAEGKGSKVGASRNALSHTLVLGGVRLPRVRLWGTSGEY